MARLPARAIVIAMNRTLLPITTAALAAAAIAAALAAAAIAVPGSFAQSTGSTLELQFPDSAPDAVTDGGKRGPGPGDRLAFTGPLTDQGVAAGTFIAAADILTKNASSAMMVATLELPGSGTIAAQGKLNFNRTNQGTLAVLGGTGKYTGAAGSITVHAASDRKRKITLKVALQP